MSETGFALEPYGWSIYKHNEIGPATISIALQRNNANLPGKRRVSIRGSDLEGLKNVVYGAWSRAGMEPEQVNTKDAGNGMIEAIVVLPERENYISWNIP